MKPSKKITGKGVPRGGEGILCSTAGAQEMPVGLRNGIDFITIRGKTTFCQQTIRRNQKKKNGRESPDVVVSREKGELNRKKKKRREQPTGLSSRKTWKGEDHHI